ncbi:flavin-containing monooxygenase 5-like [Mytilus californianus]|uniref:flavin-containing monooxygenase 5-like n=1 Tax=Mytilus californianus TaxID=6549 RepID=UPI002247F4CB|nr:flavin-containing monooxygenase 5-like [Mytilus californianus]
MYSVLFTCSVTFFIQTKRIAVIGAGASGLPAIKCCLDEALHPVCFELTEGIGGLWKYTPKAQDGRGTVMKSTVINVSKELMAFSDFPIPKEFPMFMHNTLVQKYLEMYAEHFNLLRHVQFQKEVVWCEPTVDFEKTGKWTLKIKDIKSGKIINEIFDGVMAATGHHTAPLLPAFDGQDTFKGRTLHTVQYRDPLEFSGKRVFIIGIGNSGADIACELSRVVLSTRSGSWVIQRIGNKGMPFDMLGTTRAVQYFQKCLPLSLLNSLTEMQINARFDHEKYGLKPNYPPRAQDPLISDEFHLRIANGLVQIRPNVKHFTESSVVFVDGSVYDDIDVVIFATGYKIGFPYVDKQITESRNNEVDLYKFIFPPNLTKPTFSVIGCVQPLGSITPVAELQSRVATRVFKGDVQLPTRKQMWDDIYQKRKEIAKHYTHSLRHTVMVEFIGYLDELADIIGCKPRLYSTEIFLKDDFKIFQTSYQP